MNADETIYGRYGGRDPSSPDSRNTLAGLRFSLDRALETHARNPKEKPAALPVMRAEDYAAAKKQPRSNCIHCHQINEFRRAQLISEGKWKRDMLWVYPPPENAGIGLDKDQGNLVKQVLTKSPADAAGVRAGDRLERLNGYSVNSFGDAQFALHKAPAAGNIAVSWARDGKAMHGKLELADGWRKTNITWRPSLLDILPSLSVSGDDLTAAEKKALGIPESQAAVKQDKFVHSTLKKVGVLQGDVYVGINGTKIDGTMDDFLGHLRRNHLVGDKVVLNVLRDGKPVDLPIVLK